MTQVRRVPCLPGFNFDENIGRTKFHKSHQFEKIHGDVYYLAEKSKSSSYNRYPAIYAWGEVQSRPPWLSFCDQRLKFKAYFQESIHEGRVPYRIRLVDISFFLEDGTIKISEPAVINSGLEQGVLVKRQRIPLPDPVKYRYFDILDLNIGGEPKIFGRVYKIIDCDEFTRRFLNRMGILVPDPLEAPIDPTYEKRENRTAWKDNRKKIDKLGNFLKYDPKVLRFYGYWDDSDVPYGYVHDLEILYFLADDTMEIYENLAVKYGPSKKTCLVKKIKVPKFFTNVEPIGSDDPFTILNVLGENANKSYYVTDNSFRKKSTTDYYKECDLTIGAQLNVFGRQIVITDLDDFTKEYYRKKYGLNDFTPMSRPVKEDRNINQIKYIPPFNGFGTYEDSLGNCFSVVPKRPKTTADRAYQYDKQTNDNQTLRFGTKLISDNSYDLDRCFVINVYLLDDTILVVEVYSKDKPGRTKCVFQKRMKIRWPGQDIFSNVEPKYYKPQHFYIGTSVDLQGFKFQIESADERTLKYMEEHCDEFPKSDVKLIMRKIREHLKSVYREFIENYSPIKSEDRLGRQPVLHLFCFRDAMNKYLGDRITEQEIVTVARHYSFGEKKNLRPRECVRGFVHTELTRHGWNELERLEEDIYNLDREKTGHLSRSQVYTLLRANRVPLQKDLINLCLDHLQKNEEGKIDCQDLMKFINVKIDPLPPTVPVNIKELYWTTHEIPKDCSEIDWCLFLQDLDLENELKEPAHEEKVENEKITSNDCS